jgi:Sugar kinases, ribokinase family
VRTLVDGADYLFGNEYEEALIERKSGWGSAEMLARVGVRITTLGSAGAKIEQRGEPTISVPAVPDAKPVDPTGPVTRSAPASWPPSPGACLSSAQPSSAT